MLEHYEEIYLNAEEIYNKDYSPESSDDSQYCHEQSFKWGFQEGAEYNRDYFIEKSVTWLSRLKQARGSSISVPVFDEYWLNRYRDAMKDDEWYNQLKDN